MLFKNRIHVEFSLFFNREYFWLLRKTCVVSSLLRFNFLISLQLRLIIVVLKSISYLKLGLLQIDLNSKDCGRIVEN